MEKGSLKERLYQERMVGKGEFIFTCTVTGFSHGRGGRPTHAPPRAPLRIISWNCRGLGNRDTMQAIRSLCKAKQPSCLFLMETK